MKKPVWSPTQEFIETTNIGRLMRCVGCDNYPELHKWSVTKREEFWRKMINVIGVEFKRKPKRILDLSNGIASPKWLPEAEMNIVDSCFKSRDKIAVIEYSEDKRDLRKLTYSELERLCNRVANGLLALGCKKGDAIAMDMPMTAESIAIYLGIIKMGGVVVSIADSFAVPEIEKRLRIGNAKIIFTVDHYTRNGKRLEIYSKVKEANGPKAVLSSGDGDLRDGDILWNDFLGDDKFSSVGCNPNDHTNILFSSGTTKDPKAIPWSHTTPIKCASDGHLHQDIHEDDVVAWPTSLGWMMGPWLVYATLINKATMGLFVGSPCVREFGEFVSDAGVTILGVVPCLVRGWREMGINGVDWSRIRLFSSTGECSNENDYLFLSSFAGGKPIIEYCGGTEIGGAYITGTVVQPFYPSTFSTPALGIDFVILDESYKPAKNGEVFLVPPSMGLSNELLNGDHYKEYFEGCPKGLNGELLRRHGDQIEKFDNGYFVVHGRTDDAMKLGGIRVGSSEIERVVNSHPAVLENAAVALQPKEGGPANLIVFVVLNRTTDGRAILNLREELQQLIKTNLNPLFKIHHVKIVDVLPRTASGKVMRKELRKRGSP